MVVINVFELSARRHALFLSLFLVALNRYTYILLHRCDFVDFSSLLLFLFLFLFESIHQVNHQMLMIALSTLIRAHQMSVCQPFGIFDRYAHFCIRHAYKCESLIQIQMTNTNIAKKNQHTHEMATVLSLCIACTTHTKSLAADT